jgi:long-subunit acyl-CoA synthetase (AMP-forming)
VEDLSKIIIKKKLCPIMKSDVEGTPDLKFMGIFSENRPEWIMTEIACCSDSIVIVPISTLV